jgi:hypothetical protein
MNEALQAISNVIELKPDKFYLFVFKGSFNYHEMEYLAKTLYNEGLHGISVAIQDEQSLEVIEVPKQSQEK